MNKSEILNKLFNRRWIRGLIPIINPVITFLNNGSRVQTHHDRSSKIWIHIESGIVISIDRNPNWNISFKTMEKSARALCCKKYLPKSGDIVVDLGAGVGFETVLFQRLVGESGMIFAIEAHPKIAALLEILCRKNRYKNVTICQTAIGGKSGSDFIEDREHHAANSIINDLEDGIQVAIMTFDQFVREKNIKKIDYLKINIEGSEEEAIQGMNQTIKIIKNIAVSCHDFLELNSNERIKKKVIDFLLKNNFEVEESNDKHYVRRSWVYGKRISCK